MIALPQDLTFYISAMSCSAAADSALTDQMALLDWISAFSTTRSPQEMVLLRRMLVRNARQTVPSAWQRQHLPLEPGSPWSATYLAPIYPDSAGDPEKHVMSALGEAVSSSGATSSQGSDKPAAAGGDGRRRGSVPLSGTAGSGSASSRQASSSTQHAVGSAATRRQGGRSAAQQQAAGSQQEDAGQEQCCAYCGSSSSLRRCTACKAACYCGSECQKKHWKAHKPRCTATAHASAQ